MKPSPLTLIIVLGALTTFGPLSIDMYLPALPAIATQFGASDAAVQRTLTSFFIGLVIGQLFYGPISDHFGRKPPLYLGLSLFTITSVACALAPNIVSLTGLRFVQALGSCAGMVMVRAMVRDLYAPEDMRRVFSTLMLITGLAPMLAPILGGYIFVHLGWQAIFLVLGFCGLAALAAVHFTLPETHSGDPSRKLAFAPVIRNYVALLRDPPFRVSVLICGISMAGVFAYIAGSPFVFIDFFGLSPDIFGWVFGFCGMGFALGAQINGRFLAHIPAENIVFAATRAQLGATVLLLVLALGGAGFWAIIGPLFIAVACNGFILPNATTLALAPQAARAGTASALIGIMQFGFAAITTLAVGALENVAAGPVGMLFVFGTCSLTSAILATVQKRSAPVMP